jgi:hypothetical protein
MNVVIDVIDVIDVNVWVSGLLWGGVPAFTIDRFPRIVRSLWNEDLIGPRISGSPRE